MELQVLRANFRNSRQNANRMWCSSVIYIWSTLVFIHLVPGRYWCGVFFHQLPFERRRSQEGNILKKTLEIDDCSGGGCSLISKIHIIFPLAGQKNCVTWTIAQFQACEVSLSNGLGNFPKMKNCCRFFPKA